MRTRASPVSAVTDFAASAGKDPFAGVKATTKEDLEQNITGHSCGGEKASACAPVH